MSQVNVTHGIMGTARILSKRGAKAVTSANKPMLKAFKTTFTDCPRVFRIQEMFIKCL
jgi:hypothetical protein